MKYNTRVLIKVKSILPDFQCFHLACSSFDEQQIVLVHQTNAWKGRIWARKNFEEKKEEKKKKKDRMVKTQNEVNRWWEFRRVKNWIERDFCIKMKRTKTKWKKKWKKLKITFFGFGKTNCDNLLTIINTTNIIFSFKLKFNFLIILCFKLILIFLIFLYCQRLFPFCFLVYSS